MKPLHSQASSSHRIDADDANDADVSEIGDESRRRRRRQEEVRRQDHHLDRGQRPDNRSEDRKGSAASTHRLFRILKFFVAKICRRRFLLQKK